METEGGEWLVYHPPKAVGFGHQSRIRDPRRAWPMVEQFMFAWTQYSFGHHITLTCPRPDRSIEADVVIARLVEARRIFGEETSASATFSSWKIEEPQIASAIQFALDNDKFPKQWLTLSIFDFSYVFLWKEFDRKGFDSIENDSRDGRSRLGVNVGYKGLFLQPYFIFPGPWKSALITDFVDRLKEAAPFRFRDQYFKRWLPPKSAKTKFGRHPES